MDYKLEQLQQEYRLAEQEYKKFLLKTKMCKTALITYLEQQKVKRIEPDTYVSRDIQIVQNYLKDGKKTSFQLINYLNETLKDQYVRWETSDKKLNSNLFIRFFGKHLTSENNITKYKVPTYRGYMWKLIN